MTIEEIARSLVAPFVFEAMDGALILEPSARSADPLVHAIATALRAAEARGYERAREQAARVGYAECAKTRHVTLGDAVSAAVSAMQPETNP